MSRRILYVFPHPDDESFGPAPAIAQQRRQGDEVYLLTLTRGEATSQRERLGYSKERMGQVRYDEMQDVAEALDLTQMWVLDYPDGGLEEVAPKELAGTVREYVQRVRPDVVVTYAEHGISGHADHVVTHRIVRGVFEDMTAETYPRRLALFTLPPPEQDDAHRPEHLKHSPLEAIDVVVVPEPEDMERGHAALACYVTYRSVIEEHRPLDTVRGGVCFELFDEHFDPPLDDLADRLPGR